MLERLTSLDQLRTILAVRALAFREQLGQAGKLAPQVVVVDRDDVIAELRERRTPPVGFVERVRVVVEQRDDALDVEAPLSARVAERPASTAAVIDPELLEDPRARRTLGDQVAHEPRGASRV